MKNSKLKKRKQILATLLPLVIITVLLFIPFTNKVFTGVFGYAIYSYIIIAYALAFWYLSGRKIVLPKKTAALYAALFFSLLTTIHVGLSSGMIDGGFGGYIIDPYVNHTAGGVLLSIASCLIAVPLGYTVSLVLFFILSATLLFAALLPLFVKKNQKPLPKKDTESENAEEKKQLFVHELPADVKKETPRAEPKVFGQKSDGWTEFFDKVGGRKNEPADESFGGIFAKTKPSSADISREEAPYFQDRRKAMQDPKELLFSPPSDAPAAVQTERKPPLKMNLYNASAPAQDVSGFNFAKNLNRYTPAEEPAEAAVPAAPVQSVRETPVSAQDLIPPRQAQSRSAKFNVGNVFLPNSDTNADFDRVYDLARHESATGSFVTGASEPKKREEIKGFEGWSSIPSAAKPYTVNGTQSYSEPAGNGYTEVIFDDGAEEREPAATREERQQDVYDYIPPKEAAAYRIETEPKYERPEPVRYEKPEQKYEQRRAEPVYRNQEAKPAAQIVTEQLAVEEPPKPKRPYVAPHLGLLDDHRVPSFREEISEEEFAHNKDTIEQTLAQFGLRSEVVAATKGPVLTRYEVVLHSGSVAKVANLKLDLTMRLSSKGAVDIIAPLEGKDAVGVDIPNKVSNVVSFRDVAASEAFQRDRNGLKIAIGKEIDGTPHVVDLEAMPHMLVAGATGKGKSVCINTIITSIIYQHSPDEVKFLLIDPKLVELAHYAHLPHMLVPEPLNDLNVIVKALRWVEAETKRRYEHFKAIKKLSINPYNEYARANGLKPKYKIVVIIDEASELMTKAKKETEDMLSSLARIGRAAGIHLVFATQSPMREVITSEIQNNLTTKIAFAVSDFTHSMVILKAKGAERLLGRGDMLIKSDGGAMKRVQCSFISADEKEKVIDFVIKNNDADFDTEIYDEIYRVDEPAPDEDTGEIRRMPGLERPPAQDDVKSALIIGFRNCGISTSLLQRKMGKGFAVAGRIVDYLAQQRYIDEGEPNSNKKRKILISVDEFLELFPEEESSFYPAGQASGEEE